jgi:hypothetical protein
VHREICFSTGKAKKQGKLKRLYYRLLRRGRRVCKRFERELAAVAAAGERRVLNEQKVPSQEKVISISDRDAAFIVKGGWRKRWRGKRRCRLASDWRRRKWWS